MIKIGFVSVDFLSLARRIYLSPSEAVLRDCERFIGDSESDINLLKSIDTSSSAIHYSAQGVSLGYDELLNRGKVDVENEHLVKCLVKDYAIPNIKEPS